MYYLLVSKHFDTGGLSNLINIYCPEINHLLLLVGAPILKLKKCIP